MVRLRDNPVKEQILRPMFGDEWPERRTFPDDTALGLDQVGVYRRSPAEEVCL